MAEMKKKPRLKARLRYAWRVLIRGQIPPEKTKAGAEKLRLTYERFRTILNHNDSTLQLIADIEDRLAGRFPFSLRVVEQRIEKAVLDVFVMIKNLSEIADGRYIELYDSLRRVYEGVVASVAEPETVAGGAMVVPLSALRRTDDGLAGAKMANLGEVRNVLGLLVPDGFAITVSAFNRFMSRNELWERAERLEEVLELYGPRVTEEACRQVQSEIVSRLRSPEMEEAVFAAFDELAEGEDILVAVRSSAVGEDKAVSHAGQYLTELDVGRDWLFDAYRSVIASSYGLDPVIYRQQHGLTARDAKMAVGCIKMVRPRVSGIVFSRHYDRIEEDKVVISAARGLSDTITRGRASGEDLVVGADPLALAANSCVTPQDIARLKDVARQIETHFGTPQDIEWAIDMEGRLYILQCRPMVQPKPAGKKRIEAVEDGMVPLLTGGIMACPGVGAGPVFVARGDEDLSRFPNQGVLVAAHSSPKYSRIMDKCSAIITDRGAPTGHMSILAREFAVPTIVGMEAATHTLVPGQMITVNATDGRVYDGSLPMVEESDNGSRLLASPAVDRLRRMASFVTPLHLIEPASPEFRAGACSTLHDITRFVHEKVFEAVFGISDRARASETENSLRIEGYLPYDVLVVDVGGGLAEGVGQSGTLTIPEIRSVPMLAFLDGLLDPGIKWDQPRSVSARGFLSVLGESIAGPPPEAQGVGSPSFAVISDRYMNFSTKAGYHFNTVDTYCGKSLNKNYIHFRFEGGGASESRRARRCRFLSLVLAGRDFRVQTHGDILAARLEKYDQDLIRARLTDLGRLTLCSRQLDMLMDTDDSPEFFAQAFLAGETEKF